MALSATPPIVAMKETMLPNMGYSPGEHAPSAALSMSLPCENEHERVGGCTSFENVNAAAGFNCKADAASVCVSSLVEMYSAKPLADQQIQVPAAPNFSVTHPEEVPVPLLETENENNMPRTVEEMDADEADSWLLLDPDDNKGNQTYAEEIDDFFSIMEGSSWWSEYQCNQQQLYCANEGGSGSDGVLPAQSFKMKEQDGRWQHQHQQHKHDVSFNWEFEASKAAFISSTSSGQSKATGGHMISNSCTRYPTETTELSPMMPLQSTPIGREAKVLRYREKRKARKFNKKIRYASRKAYAETRPRVKGRFAKKIDSDSAVDHLFSSQDNGHGNIGPSS